MANEQSQRDCGEKEVRMRKRPNAAHNNMTPPPGRFVSRSAFEACSVSDASNSTSDRRFSPWKVKRIDATPDYFRLVSVRCSQLRVRKPALVPLFWHSLDRKSAYTPVNP